MQGARGHARSMVASGIIHFEPKGPFPDGRTYPPSKEIISIKGILYPV